MVTRRTASADSLTHQNSPSTRNTPYSTPHDSVLATPASYPGKRVADAGSPLRHLSKHSSSSPARLQRTRQHARQNLPSTTSSQRRLPTCSPQPCQSQLTKNGTYESRAPSSRSASQIPRPRRQEKPDCLWEAVLDPPITKDSLSELDLTRIVNDGRLRHDLHFEHEIMFRPNTYGVRGENKKREEDLYFEAVAIELGYYIRHQRSPRSSPSRQQISPNPSKPRTSSPSDPPRRVPHMIAVIRDIVKVLVPAAKWASVDDQLDVELRMQELEHGICDIAGLIDWLGKLLLCSCSPMRDPIVKAMLTSTQEAIAAQDARQLVNAIKDLFGVLETMKLDVANHQIRYLRFYLLEDGIQFEQNEVLRHISAGWSISHERHWFEAGYDNPDREDPFLMFKDSVIETIVSSTDEFPVTFINDYDRLRALQQDFRLCHYHAACIATFRDTLHQLGWRHPLPVQSYTRALQNVWAVVAGLGNSFTFGAHYSVVLQLVTEAFRVCNISALPDSRTLFYTSSALKEALSDHGDVKRRVWDELARVAHVEAEVIFNLTPLEILNRYDLGPNTATTDTPRKADLSLENLARRTAHVLVLHWRVWAPIFYNQPAPGSDFMRQPLPTVTSEQEMSERKRVGRESCSVKASKPTITDGETMAHRSRSASLSQDSDESRPSGRSLSSSSAGEEGDGQVMERQRMPRI